jgi:two-component system, chemotaxis family, CheB/CheR fusion protein
VGNILDSSTQYSIIGKDLQRRIVLWNEGARRNYGYAAREVLGKSSDLLHSAADLRSGIVDRLHREARLRGKAEGRFERVRKDGSTFPASVVITRRDDAQGRPVGYLVISRDISSELAIERERAKVLAREKQLLSDENRFKTEFVNMAAHELLTPLTPIRALLSLVAAHPSLAGEADLRRHMEIVQRNFERMNRLVEDLLSASRMDLGKLQLRSHDVDVTALVKATVDAFATAAQERQVSLETRLRPTPAVRADPDRLSQVFFNLLSNALKFTPPGGRITVRCGPKAPGVEVALQDTGAGIDPAFRVRMFKPFSRAEAHATGFPGGTGLGLYVSKGIIDLHGGSLTAHSKGPGKGTRMVVRLPVA